MGDGVVVEGGDETGLRGRLPAGFGVVADGDAVGHGEGVRAHRPNAVSGAKGDLVGMSSQGGESNLLRFVILREEWGFLYLLGQFILKLIYSVSIHKIFFLLLVVDIGNTIYTVVKY